MRSLERPSGGLRAVFRLTIFMTVRHAIPLLAGVASLAAPASAGAFQVGIQDDAAFVSAPPAQRAKAFDYAHGMGVTYLRITMVWEGFRGDGFAPYDAAVNEARKRGMTVQLTLTGNPKFTNDGQGYLAYRNPSPSRYARWMGQIARHFRGRVAAYSVWNEPNLRRLSLSPDRRPPRGRSHHLRPAGARRLRRRQARRPRRQGADRRDRALESCRSASSSGPPGAARRPARRRLGPAPVPVRQDLARPAAAPLQRRDLERGRDEVGDAAPGPDAASCAPAPARRCRSTSPSSATRAPAPTTGSSPRRCATGTRSRPSGWPSARARRCWCGTSSTTIPGGLAPASGTRA